MRVIVAGEYRLYRGPDGHHYAESVFSHDFWERYLDVFDEVLVVARVTPTADVAALIRVDGPRVSVWEMPYYVGLAGYVRAWRTLRRAAAAVGHHEGAVVLRVPGAIGTALATAIPASRPYALEVVGDPAEVFSKGVVEPPLRRLLRWKAVRDLRRLCRRAVAVAYVSRYELEPRYPASPGTPTFAYSSAAMPEEAFSARPRGFPTPLRSLIAIGSMDQMYKGFDVLIRCLPDLLGATPELRLTLVGGGRHRGELEALVRELGVGEAVQFTGVVKDPAEIRRLLDGADLFVSASRTEGLPRTVIEAHARGVPCVGTRVGATPELLRDEDMCPPDDESQLGSLIAKRIKDPDWAMQESARAWAQARRYEQSRLQAERNRMLRTLHAATARNGATAD